MRRKNENDEEINEEVKGEITGNEESLWGSIHNDARTLYYVVSHGG
jgi:hypothetical protein